MLCRPKALGRCEAGGGTGGLSLGCACFRSGSGCAGRLGDARTGNGESGRGARGCRDGRSCTCSSRLTR